VFAPRRYEHQSTVLGCTMKFSIIDGLAGKEGKKPVIYWLSGLTCNDRNFVDKAGCRQPHPPAPTL
jgi:S-formylglutathione hydrolase